MEYVILEALENSIFLKDNIPVEFIILPKVIYDDLDEHIKLYSNIKIFDDIIHLFLEIKSNFDWFRYSDIVDIIQTKIVWDKNSIAIIQF